MKEEIGVHNIDSINRKFVQIMNNIAWETIPTSIPSVGRKIKVPWWNEDCKLAIQGRWAALKRLRKTLRLEDVIEYKRKRAIAQRTIKRAKSASWKSFCSSVNPDTPLKTIWGKSQKYTGS